MRLQPTPLASAVAAALLTLTASSALAQSAPVSAAAADAATEPDNAKESRNKVAEPQRIVITGTGRAVQASKVPYNATALTEEALRENNITDVKKLISQSLGISAPENSARFADSVTVRGLNISPVNANNLEQFVKSTLSYYLDDTPLPNIGYRIKDISRVETLLGPQGTLYGAGSLGGTVRFITNKPLLGKTEARINTGFYQTKDGGLSNDTDVVFNLPVGSNVALRASVARLDEAGYIDRVSNPPWRTGADAWTTKPDPKQNVYKNDDWQKVNGGRFSALWRVAPGIDITFAHTQQDQSAHGTSGVSLLPLGVANARTPAEVTAAWKNPDRTLAQLPCNPNCPYTNESQAPVAVDRQTILSRYPEFADRKFRMDSVDVDIDLGFANLHSSTSQFTDSRIGQADYASQGYAYYYSLGDLGGAIDSGRSAYMTFDNSYKGLSHETRLTSKGDGPLSWIAGLYYTKQNRNLRFSEVLPGMDAFLGADKAQKSPLPDVGYSEDLGSKYKETALFGEVGYRITPVWQVNVGARVFNYTDTALGKIVDYAGGYVDSDTTATGGSNGKSYYKLNTSYQWTEELLSYFTYSQGFRRGGTNGFKNLSATKIVAADAKQYKPDSTDNIEIGLKGYLFDRQLYIETGVYQINWKDPQTYRAQDVSGFPVNGTANGPDARTRGWEFAGRYKINELFSTSFSTTTTRGQWVATKKHCLYADGSSCRTWSEGGQLGAAPKWKHNLSLRFNTTLSNDWYVWGSLSARHTAKVQTDRADSPAENATVPTYNAYTQYGLNGGVSIGKLDLSLWIQNLTNVQSLRSTNAAGLMGYRAIYGTPRTVGVNASYSFF
jgi:outer membrane receptor protein involved in Fe transport